MKTKTIITKLFPFIILLLLLNSPIVLGDEYTVRLTIPEITSEGSAEKARATLKEIQGVFDVESNVLRHTATFTYEDDETEVDQIEQVLGKAGFSVEKVDILREPQKKE